MTPVKWGIIGLGHIGRRHADLLLAGRIPGAKLEAVATTHPDWIQKKPRKPRCTGNTLI